MMLAYVGKDERLLGASCIGAHATDICAEAALAIKHGLKVNDVAETIHAHPTYSEIVPEVLEDALGRAVHKAGKAVLNT
jgi:dihydrolipoamide dehydrogenase